ncbi:uncharacterized protein TNCT_687921, partial [Trichonephila clavata]
SQNARRLLYNQVSWRTNNFHPTVSLHERLKPLTIHISPMRLFVTRILKRVSDSFHLPWSHVLELSRQAPYLMDSNFHQDLLKIWTQRSKMPPWTNNIVWNVFGSRLCPIFGFDQIGEHFEQSHDPKTIYEFFAMDGYQGDDPKKYVELFRYDAQDLRGKHVRAVLPVVPL